MRSARGGAYPWSCGDEQMKGVKEGESPLFESRDAFCTEGDEGRLSRVTVVGKGTDASPATVKRCGASVGKWHVGETPTGLVPAGLVRRERWWCALAVRRGNACGRNCTGEEKPRGGGWLPQG